MSKLLPFSLDHKCPKCTGELHVAGYCCGKLDHVNHVIRGGIPCPWCMARGPMDRKEHLALRCGICGYMLYTECHGPLKIEG